MIQKQKLTKGLKMKETLKDKYIKLLNNTIDVGNCSKCGSTNLVYDNDVNHVDGEDVFKFYTCNDCNYEGVEWYTFNGHSDKSLPSQYYSDIRDEFNKLSS